MGTKRKRDDFNASQNHLHDSRKNGIDPQYGQRYAFPGLEDSDIDPEDETSLEAIKYLRSVRAEAQGLPGLLVANLNATSELEYASRVGGLYIDGAYISAPDLPEDIDSLHESLELQNDLDYDDIAYDNVGQPPQEHPRRLLEAQEVYHQALLKRYQAFRSLSDNFESGLQQVLDPETHPTFIDLDVSTTVEEAKWIRIFQNINPKSSQLSTMSLETIIELLKRLPPVLKRKHWVNKDGQVGQTISLWIWSLLGRLPELGTMSSEEVAVVRDLAKKAAIIAMSLDRNDAAARIIPKSEQKEIEEEIENITLAEDTAELLIPVEESKESVEDHVGATDAESEEAIRNAKTALLSDLVQIEEKQHSLNAEQIASSATVQQLAEEDHLVATLDMILTIVGEYYGQRDLLIDRERLWIQTTPPMVCATSTELDQSHNTASPRT